MEGVTATDLAIDRPSTKFLSFLKKHYKLHCDIKQVLFMHTHTHTHFIIMSLCLPQGNNFVVFSQFFHSKFLAGYQTRECLDSHLSVQILTCLLDPAH